MFNTKASLYRLFAKYDTAQDAADSTMPLLEPRKSGGAEPVDPDYNPFEERSVKHPTNDTETFVHLLKGSLGAGILAMPLAFRNAGLWFGLVSTIVVGIICTYCIHILVTCAHILCHRRHMPLLTFADVAEQAFLDGPPALNRYATFIRYIVNTFLSAALLGACCIYMVLVGANLKQVLDFYDPYNGIGLRFWILLITCPLIFMCLIRNLKYLTPFSMFANVAMFLGIIITLYYVFTDLPSVSEREPIADIIQWPLFVGTVIFALEGIGVVMSLENDMKTPTHFTGCWSVLSAGMGTIIVLYSTIGFFGFWKYGDDTLASVTLNLPVNERLAQSVKLMIAAGIFFTFTLQFYVPLNIIWKGMRNWFAEEHQVMAEYILRMGLVIICGSIAMAFPNLGPFISLIGAVCLSTLGLILPPIIELAVYYETPGYGYLKWRMLLDIFMIIFGIIGFSTGMFVSLLEFEREFSEFNEEEKSSRSHRFKWFD